MNWTIVSRGTLLQTRAGRLMFFDGMYSTDSIYVVNPETAEQCIYSTAGFELAPGESVERLTDEAVRLHRELYPWIYEGIPETASSAFDTQVDGEHYCKLPKGYQPFQISKVLGLNPVEHTILKYLLRHRNKNGKVDLQKIKQCVDILIEQEYPNE